MLHSCGGSMFVSQGASDEMMRISELQSVILMSKESPACICIGRVNVYVGKLPVAYGEDKYCVCVVQNNYSDRYKL